MSHTRLSYIAPLDGVRPLDPSFEANDFDSRDFPFSQEQVRSIAEGVESEFERRTQKFTETATEEKHEGIIRDNGYTVYLDHQDVLPFDPAKGDSFEVRNGPDADDFEDVTDDVVLDENRGIVEVQRTLLSIRITWEGFGDTNQRFRVNYRYGSGEDSGQTTLEEAITDADTTPLTVDVNNAETIPVNSRVIIGDEYFFVAERDTEASQNTLTFEQRAIRGSAQNAHDSGDRVKFTAQDIRSAMSAKVAWYLVQSDDYLDVLSQGAESYSTSDRLSALDEQFEEGVSRYQAGHSGYV
jgi:hypothetical protein